MRSTVDAETNTPVMYLSVNNKKLFCTIDTGYNGYLWTDFLVARDLLRLDVTGEPDNEAVMADGSQTPFELVWTTVEWFGSRIPIPIQVIPQPRGQKTQALIGTRLLLGYMLVADFNHGHVEIVDPAQ